MLKIKKYKILKIIFLLYLLRLLCGSIYLFLITPATEINEISEYNYYINFDFFKEKKAICLDSNNVSYVDYSRIKSLGVDNGISYNPITIGMMGIRYYQEFEKDSSKVNLKLVVSHCNWLKNNIDSLGQWTILHNKKIDNSILKSPWPSALAQGFGMSALVRGFAITKDSSYLYCAQNALKAFTIDLKNGGILTENEFGVFFEEYPIAEPDHVLNGFIYALFGLHDVYKHTGDTLAKGLFDEGIKSLKTILSQYDSGNWTKYSLNKTSNLKNHWNYSSPFYQKIYISQMKGLYLITQDDMFLKYNIKFENQSSYSWVNLIIYPSYVVYTDFVLLFKFFR